MINIHDKIKAGIYIFEGIDNVGKTSVIKELKETIENKTGRSCMTLAFPGNEPGTLGSLVYDIHHNQSRYFVSGISDISLQMLHVASHIELLQKMKVGTSENEVILLDRFWWSTYVYGVAANLGADTMQSIIDIELAYWESLNIQKIFLLEREGREKEYCNEKDDKIVNLYRELAKNESKCTIINNDCNISDTVTNIYDCIMRE